MDVDYDELIEDYIEEGNERHDENEYDYEQHLLDDMLAAGTTAAVMTDASSAPESPHDEDVSRTNHELQPSVVGDGAEQDHFESGNIRNRLHEVRETRGADLFSFERYTAMTSWRSDKPKSSDGMKATEWKSHWTTSLETARSSLFEDRSASLGRTQAPDVQLMELSRPPRRIVAIRSLRYKYGRPVAGSKSVAMTLGSGTRLYFRVEEEQPKIQDEQRASGSILGISIESLMRHVNAIRRRKEHDLMHTAAAPTANDVDARASKESETHRGNSTRQKRLCDGRLWVDKHAPTTFAHLLSDERANREVLRALRAWDPYVFHREAPPRPTFGTAGREETETTPPKSDGKKKKELDNRPDETSRVILLSGPSGIGKTTLAHIIARHAGYRPIEVNGSDERSAGALTERLVRAMESSTLNFASKDNQASEGRPNCIIMDEIDGADAKGAIKALVDIIRAKIPSKKAKRSTFLRRPIIFICNNKWTSALKPLLPYSKQFDLSPPTTVRLVSRLQAVLKSEGLSVPGGSAMLTKLASLSGGDIRSCLYTMQFAAYRARELSCVHPRSMDEESPLAVDIGEPLSDSLGGKGMKDERSDIAGTITTVFQKRKDAGMKQVDRSVDRVIRTVLAFGDGSRALDTLFLNVPRISYIDPAFDRCALAQEWLSLNDTFRSQKTTNTGAQIYLQNEQAPVAAAALHLLCRVEQRPELIYTIREFHDNQFRQEKSHSLVHRFVEGISPQSRCGRSIGLMVIEFIPYIISILSAGQGVGALSRAVTSLGLLNVKELKSFCRHADVLHALGLSYKLAEQDGQNEKKYTLKQAPLLLNPPINQLVMYDLPSHYRRDEVSAGIKTLLSRKLVQESYVCNKEEIVAKHEYLKGIVPVEQTDKPNPLAKRKAADTKEGMPLKKKSKADSPTSVVPTSRNFLQIGARKALEAKSARHAARVGYDRCKQNKKSHTGSGVPLAGVLRLKFVKGYTEAVRTPCYIDELL